MRRFRSVGHQPSTLRSQCWCSVTDAKPRHRVSRGSLSTLIQMLFLALLSMEKVCTMSVSVSSSVYAMEKELTEAHPQNRQCDGSAWNTLKVLGLNWPILTDFSIVPEFTSISSAVRSHALTNIPTNGTGSITAPE
ncbi:hypothetical protein OGATHE_004820 [Ogataea polymorpha]|uniref:Uncharacterized protein n=1 Tax=Ogataea polymorpha TaxID=460523 RepID=A0A9P8T2J4_9ASCO|nr:hypothetical protein OGATHE_004820 [Ogataea polymorpha]